MSQHSSLKADSVGIRHRNVLKRHERIRVLQEGEGFAGRQSAFCLPKLKLIKLKVKKAKGAKEAEGAEGQTAPAAGQASAPQTAASKASAEKPKTNEKPKAK